MKVWRIPTILVISLTFGLAGCASSKSSEADSNSTAKQTADANEVTAKEEKSVKAHLEEHFEAKSQDGVYSIPEHREYPDARGSFAGFHTVHQKSADTYYVCVDFEDPDRDRLYDVDFYLKKTGDGLSLTKKYLHKVDGKDVTQSTN